MRGGRMIAGEKPAKGMFKKSLVKLLKYCKKYYVLGENYEKKG